MRCRRSGTRRHRHLQPRFGVPKLCAMQAPPLSGACANEAGKHAREVGLMGEPADDGHFGQR